MKEAKCRVIVLGASRARLQAVMGLLLSPQQEEEGSCDVSCETDDGRRDVSVEYVPCVPAFGSYLDDATGRRVRYLARLDYLGADASLSPPGTILPFLDEFSGTRTEETVGDRSLDRMIDHKNGDEHANTGKPSGKKKPPVKAGAKPSILQSSSTLFGPIAGMVVGGGIGNDDGGDVSGGGGADDAAESKSDPRQTTDVQRVVRFVESVVAQTNLQLPPSRPLPVELVRPAPGYRTLRDELDAYRALSDEERVAATERGTMGPGKVARVAKAFARRLVSQALEQRRRDLLEQASPEKPTTNADDPEVLSKGEGGVHKFTGSDNPDRRSLEATIPALDPTLSRYACRTCRCLLFGHEHLQDPPHMPSRHKFSYRKHDISQPSSGGQCQSLFLQSVLGWMGDACEVEGRVDCPRCKLKLGSWNWAGAQCSCGTWVVPAIQIPCSRVDVVAPSATPIRQGVGLDVLPPGTVISPVILLQQHGMRSNVRDGS